VTKSSDSAVLRTPEEIAVGNFDSDRPQRNEEARFHCSEIVLGRLLGTGAFCDVHDLYEINLLSRNELEQRKSPITKDIEQQKREFIYRTCRDGGDRPRYAIKHLRPNLNADRGIKVFTHAAIDCLKEFDILSRLSHRNIVRLWGSAKLGRTQKKGNAKNYGKIIEENNPEAFFIILEKLQETLSQRILRWTVMNKRVPPTCIADSGLPLPPFYLEKLRYASDIASALVHIHSQRMVFRDLKPDNVGIASDGTAKLFDFGLCRDLPTERDDMSRSNSGMKREPMFRMSTVGTRRYMSPEMIRGNGYNQKTDSYSWALVFYEMMSLQKPYDKYNREMHKDLVCERLGRPHISIDFPWSARDLLQRSWCDEVADRLSTSEICNEVDQMIETVQQQTLPLIERSLRAVVEMAELFELGNDKTLACIPGGAISVCNTCDPQDSSELKCPSSSSSSSSETEPSTKLSASAAATRSAIAME